MDKKYIINFAGVGLLASILIFIGDMLFYFTTVEINDMSKELLPSMGLVPKWRLFTGGVLGPIAAFLYLFGIYAIYLSINNKQKFWAILLSISFAIGIIAGGSAHSIFPVFGILANLGHPELIDILAYLQILGYISFIGMGLSWTIFTVLVLAKKTLLPRLSVLFNPTVLLWFGDLTHQLPKPYKVVIAGGWNNIILIIFFLSFILFVKKVKDTNYNLF